MTTFAGWGIPIGEVAAGSPQTIPVTVTAETETGESVAVVSAVAQSISVGAVAETETGQPVAGRNIDMWYTIAPNDASAAIKALADETVDGTDDHVQINTALATYTTIMLLPGTFDVGAPIEIPSGGILGGSGWTTILKANGITTGNRAVVTNDSSTARGCQVRDLQIHGNYASGGPCHGVNFVNNTAPTGEPDTGPDAVHKVTNCLISKCDGSGTTYSGIRLYSTNSNNRSSFIEACYMRENGAYNILIDGSSDNFVIGNHFGGCNGVGIRANGGNTHIWTTKQFFADGNGVEMPSSRTICEGLSVQDNGADGLNITGADSMAIGIQADTNGRLVAGDGINLEANGCRVDFISLDRGGTPRQDYGIRFSNSPTDCMVTGITKNNQTGHYTGTRGARTMVAIVTYGSGRLVENWS